MSSNVDPMMDDNVLKGCQELLECLRSVFNGPYRGDLFGNCDSTMGMLYLSRMPSTNLTRRQTRLEEASTTLSIVENIKHSNNKAESIKTSAESASWLEKRQKFSHSLCTLCSKVEKRIELVHDNALRALIILSKIEDDIVTRNVARSFSLLSEEPSIRRSLLEENGFVQCLVPMLASAISSVRIDSTIALCNVASIEGSEVCLAREGTAAGLLGLISSYPISAPVSIRALYNLTTTADGYAKLDEVNVAVTTLISTNIGTLLQNSLNQQCREECIELLIKSLCNLCHMKTNQQRLVETGIVRVIEIETKHSTIGNVRVLCQCLLNLAQCSRSRSKMVEHRIIPLVLKIQRDSLDMVTTVKCMSTLCFIASDPACRDKVVSNDTLQAIGFVIQESAKRLGFDSTSQSQQSLQDLNIMRICAKIIKVCCNDVFLAPRVAGAGIMNALDSLIRINDPIALQFAAESICCLFRFDVSLTRLLHQGAISVLVRIGECSTDSITTDWCAFSFYHIASNKDCPQELLQGRVLNIMLRMLKVAVSQQTKRLCLGTLLRLTEHHEVSSAQAIPVLVELLSKGSDDISKTICAASLYNLATEDSNCEIMLNCGALLPVVSLIQTDYVSTKMQCAAILSRLSSYQTRLGDIIGVDLVRALLDLSSIDHKATQRQVVTALFYISKHPMGRPLLREQKTMASLVSLMSRPDEQIRRGSVAIVVNLTSDLHSEAAVVSIISTIAVTATVATDNVITRKLCLKSLANFLADESLHDLLVNEGILWVMANLSKLDDLESKKIIATVFCNLSRKFAEEMLASSLVVKEIIRLLGELDVETHLYAARALFNILLISTPKHLSYRLLAVERLSTLAKSPSNEARELCVLCLCLVSQSNECRPEIVSREILGLIDGEVVLSKIQVSYAYVAMFSNLACWESMRTRLMDENCIARLQQVSGSNDASLQLAVARALYCLSCSSENHMSLVVQNSVNLIEMMASDSSGYNTELILLMTAFLYNLTTSDKVQSLVANSNLVLILRKFWAFFSNESDQISSTGNTAQPDPLLLICQAVTNLSCGRVNSTRLIQNGIAEILCKIPIIYPQNYELCLACSAAMRNLVCVFDNHQILISAGVINSLLKLSSLNLGKEILHHCATAIRTITYHEKFREELFHNGAIDIILNEDAAVANSVKDSKHEAEILGSHSLLMAVEAESWVNKSRGPNSEGRCEDVPGTALFLDFLQGECKIFLNSTTASVKLDKYTAVLSLDAISAGDDSTSHREETNPSFFTELCDLKSLDAASQGRFQLEDEEQSGMPKEKLNLTVSNSFEMCGVTVELTRQPLRKSSAQLDQRLSRSRSRRGSLLQAMPIISRPETTSDDSTDQPLSIIQDRPKSAKKPKYLSPITRMNKLVNVIQSDGSVDAILKEWNAHIKG